MSCRNKTIEERNQELRQRVVEAGSVEPSWIEGVGQEDKDYLLSMDPNSSEFERFCRVLEGFDAFMNTIEAGYGEGAGAVFYRRILGYPESMTRLLCGMEITRPDDE